MKPPILLASTLLGALLLSACATTGNDLAVALCEDSSSCTVSNDTPLYGPPQQRALEQDRRDQAGSQPPGHD